MSKTNRSSVASMAILALMGVAASFVLVSGCSVAGRSIDVTKLGSANQVLVYEAGRPVVERSIAAGSDEDKAVTSWLRSHGDGWRSDLVSYAPVRRVRGESFTLDFHKDRCILNYQINKDGDWSQVSRPLSGNEPIPEVFTPTR